MAGQYQEDCIGIPFSGVVSKSGTMVISEVPIAGKRQSKAGHENLAIEAFYNKNKDRFDDISYYG